MSLTALANCACREAEHLFCYFFAFLICCCDDAPVLLLRSEGTANRLRLYIQGRIDARSVYGQFLAAEVGKIQAAAAPMGTVTRYSGNHGGGAAGEGLAAPYSSPRIFGSNGNGRASDRLANAKTPLVNAPAGGAADYYSSGSPGLGGRPGADSRSAPGRY